MKKLLLTLTLVYFSLFTYSQEQKKHEKKSYVDKQGSYYVQVDLPIYVFISTNTDPKDAHKLKSEKTPEYANPMYLDGHGTHFIKHTDNVKPIPEKDVSFEVHADGIAPISSLVFGNSTSYTNNTTKFYGPGLTIEMTCTDEMSGIQNQYISIDKGDYKEYSQAEKISKEGKHNILAYAVDNVGNIEKSLSKEFILDITAPKTNITYEGPKTNINNELVVGPKGKYILSTQDNLSGVKKTYYTYDNTETPILYNGDPLYIKSFKEGTHSIGYYAIDHVKNQESKQSSSFFLDKTAPNITLKIKEDSYQRGSTTYVSDRTKLVLSATDNKAGVKEIHYSYGDGTYTKYEKEISFTRNTKIYTYGIDKVGNIGKKQSNQILYHLDNTSPSVSHKYIGPKFFTRDTTFIREVTKIKLTGQDQESRLKEITYSMDQSNTTTYSSPFTVAKTGIHTIKYTGKDNVNNTKSKDFFFFVDNEAPKLHIHFGSEPLGFKKIREKEIKIYSKHSKLYLAGTDNAVGTDKIYYSINNGTESLYVNPIKNFITGKNYTIKVRAIDYLGNQSSSTIEFSVEE
ncbi:OmpL47-type beta-barrel domain-containing protein [Aquimarina sp. 2201CG5-10]|uniref:OmpL47-type beta-barrel domain-containing protein n=1 Tax=Aquimarina callyspongiae TaxID=3098150 RepID=UPI002AB33A5D|nr:Ig-like domain-containing protein [Aquimarina sp. 2201CG5-10]MDY8134256.1 Ig-like domain-containing protein [Aquimarina sp. 2201CG5-10]